MNAHRKKNKGNTIQNIYSQEYYRLEENKLKQRIIFKYFISINNNRNKLRIPSLTKVVLHIKYY